MVVVEPEEEVKSLEILSHQQQLTPMVVVEPEEEVKSLEIAVELQFEVAGFREVVRVRGRLVELKAAAFRWLGLTMMSVDTIHGSERCPQDIYNIHFADGAMALKTAHGK